MTKTDIKREFMNEKTSSGADSCPVSFPSGIIPPLPSIPKAEVITETIKSISTKATDTLKDGLNNVSNASLMTKEKLGSGISKITTSLSTGFNYIVILQGLQLAAPYIEAGAAMYSAFQLKSIASRLDSLKRQKDDESVEIFLNSLSGLLCQYERSKTDVKLIGVVSSSRIVQAVHHIDRNKTERYIEHESLFNHLQGRIFGPSDTSAMINEAISVRKTCPNCTIVFYFYTNDPNDFSILADAIDIPASLGDIELRGDYLGRQPRVRINTPVNFYFSDDAPQRIRVSGVFINSAHNLGNSEGVIDLNGKPYSVPRPIDDKKQLKNHRIAGMVLSKVSLWTMLNFSTTWRAYHIALKNSPRILISSWAKCIAPSGTLSLAYHITEDVLEYQSNPNALKMIANKYACMTASFTVAYFASNILGPYSGFFRLVMPEIGYFLISTLVANYQKI